ncbi:hypothetical protein [Jatrophihabitans sp.]|uniref:hypothetical protein n=1 Tax=Jatrophihabitans sp. TaxID=1932789 RepID=UPI0030C705AB|nr:hypothetical protein [Jatrophihabitans sp.]
MRSPFRRRARSNIRTDATLRTFLAPRWLGLHLLFWGAVAGMVLLGRWQLQVSDRRHFDLQNFSYVIQWWFFAAVTLWFWGRLIRDAIRPPLTTASGSGLAVQSSGVAAYVGPADLVTSSASPDGTPVVYRGYAMPHSAVTPARSEDGYQGEYNDFLWQLALADEAKEQRRSAGEQRPPDDAPAIDA